MAVPMASEPTENAGPDATPASVFIGLMSGTSADAVDAVLARFDPRPTIIAQHELALPDRLRQRVLALARQDAAVALRELGELDGLLADTFAMACKHLLAAAGVTPSHVRAIGSHGQTVAHHPAAQPPFTMQLGNPARIAEATGIDVVADFRAADMAAGGQGAPLVPAFHAALFAAPDETRVILNLGGIANITILRRDAPVTGFDTGPANGLMDAWIDHRLGQPCDRDGQWAASGTVNGELLARCLDDPFFRQAPPKSTGREHFNLDWLQTRLPAATIADVDIQASLLALTVSSVVEAIHVHAPDARRVIACGGGVHNSLLMAALQGALQPMALETTARHGVDPDSLEALAFAWLARQHLLGLPGNLPYVTGARGPRVLGSISPASSGLPA